MELEAVPSDLLEETVPFLDWGEAVSALQESLHDWINQPSEKIKLLIGAPYGGTA
jgi:hypothetical protein